MQGPHFNRAILKNRRSFRRTRFRNTGYIEVLALRHAKKRNMFLVWNCEAVSAQVIESCCAYSVHTQSNGDQKQAVRSQ